MDQPSHLNIIGQDDKNSTQCENLKQPTHRSHSTPHCGHRFSWQCQCKERALLWRKPAESSPCMHGLYRCSPSCSTAHKHYSTKTNSLDSQRVYKNVFLQLGTFMSQQLIFIYNYNLLHLYSAFLDTQSALQWGYLLIHH